MKVSGIKDTAGVGVDIDAKKITLTSANVDTENLSVTNGYTIILDNSVAQIVHKDAGWENKDGELIYTTASNSGSFDGLNYVTALAAKSFTLEGLSDETSFEISGNKFILSSDTLANAITIILTTSDSYELKLTEKILDVAADIESEW
ncbi:MAG: hypothetical protein IJT73_01730, partial [Selenomonadaceae bacterium]|nr:hypothetical protein [Selenomonadaceae bacterium]